MYNVRWLFRVAQEGLADLTPAVRQAFNADPTDDRLEVVYGEAPRRNILLIALVGSAVGVLFDRLGPDFAFKGDIDWAAVLIGVTHATLIRRYLFRSDSAQSADFPWLAASMAPAMALLMLISAASSLAPDPDASPLTVMGFLGSAFVAAADALGVAAALTIAVAALCFSRNWLRALWDLTLRLVVFRFTVWLTVLVILEIGIVGPIVSALLQSLLGITIPQWLPDLFDQVSYAAFMSVIYLAVIGATWTVCRNSFAELLDTGQVDILQTVAAMAKQPKPEKEA